MKGIPDDYDPPDLERVPAVTELASSGLAIVLERTTKGVPTVFRLKPEGQQIINDTMARNAARCRAWQNGEYGDASFHEDGQADQ